MWIALSITKIVNFETWSKKLLYVDQYFLHTPMFSKILPVIFSTSSALVTYWCICFLTRSMNMPMFDGVAYYRLDNNYSPKGPLEVCDTLWGCVYGICNLYDGNASHVVIDPMVNVATSRSLCSMSIIPSIHDVDDQSYTILLILNGVSTLIWIIHSALLIKVGDVTLNRVQLSLISIFIWLGTATFAVCALQQQMMISSYFVPYTVSISLLCLQLFMAMATSIVAIQYWADNTSLSVGRIRFIE